MSRRLISVTSSKLGERVPAVLPAQVQPRTHNIPVALVHLRSHYPNLLSLFLHFSMHAASALGIPVSKPVFLPVKRTLWTVPRSPFVYKKSQQNFERKVHKRVIKAWDAHDDVVRRWLLYLRLHSLGGVAVRVTRWQRLPVGVGKEMLETINHTMKSSTVPEQIKKLGEKIVRVELAAGQEAEQQSIRS